MTMPVASPPQPNRSPSTGTRTTARSICEYEPWDQKIYQGYWLEIELITGHRFEAKRDINGDDIGVLTIQLRDDKAVAIRPQAIIAVTFLEQLETPAEAEGSPTPAA
jgi:hypothetical protein